MADSKVDRPRSDAKARLLQRAERLAGLATRFHEMMEDNYIPDAVCEQLDRQLTPLLDAAATLGEEADRECSAAAPQANAATLSIQQERDGLGKLGKLPRELRTQIWELLPDVYICDVAVLSRATNAEVLPIIMNHVQLWGSGETVSDRAMGNVVRRLATIGQLQVRKLEIFGIDNSFTRLMVAIMGPTLESLKVDAPLGSKHMEQLTAPRLHTLSLRVPVPLETDDGEELYVASGVTAPFDGVIPTKARLEHLGLCLVPSFDAYYVDEDDFVGVVVELSLLLQPVSHHVGLRSLTIEAPFDGMGQARSTLAFEDTDEATAHLPALTALAVKGESRMSLSEVELSRIVQLAPSLTRLFLDVNWKGTGPAQLPAMPLLRVLAITSDFAEALRGSVDLGKLDSLTLLNSSDAWYTQGSVLAAFAGALSLRHHVSSSSPYFSGALATFAARHLSFWSLGAYKWARLVNLPPQLQTLQLARCEGGASIHSLRQPGRSEAKDALNDIFVRLPALSLLVVESTFDSGGFVRLNNAPDEDGYIFCWSHKDHLNSKTFNGLFGTLETYQNNWWD